MTEAKTPLALTAGMKALVVHSVCADMSNYREKAEALKTLIRLHSPGVLVVNGDASAPGLTADEDNAVYSALICETGIPTIRIFGDNEDREARKALSTDGAFAVSEFGDAVYPVYDSDGKFRSALWCMDSHREVGDYEKDFGSPHRARPANPLYSRYYMDGIRFCQTMWYRRTSEKLRDRYGKHDSVMLFHTPIPEHLLILCNAQQTEMRGHQGERLRCQTVNGGLFASAVEMKNVREIICDHCERGYYNDFSGHYCGIALTMAPSFDFGAYSFIL